MIVNGTYYPDDTPQNLITVLEGLRESHTRVKVDYGNVATGESWNEEFDVTGYIGRTTGTKKALILVHNSRSLGGSILLINCLLSIRESKYRGKVLWTR